MYINLSDYWNFKLVGAIDLFEGKNPSPKDLGRLYIFEQIESILVII